MALDEDELEDSMAHLVKMLIEKLGRIPTEDEVMAFIFGSDEDRKKLFKGR